jgi:hypothetical protein
MADPSTKSAAFAELEPVLFKVNALAGGTEAMRAAGEELLPKHPEEEPQNYAARLRASTLVNCYVKALDAAEGRVFQSDMELTGVPATLEPLLDDIDGSGNTVEQFARDGFWHKIHHGATYLVADFPKLEEQPVTLRDAKQLSARPYLYVVHAPQVIAAYAKIEGGNERLAHFRWSTTITEPAADFLGEKVVEVIRAYSQPLATDPITLTEWRKTDKGWQVLEDPVEIKGQATIPVFCDYGWRTGFFVGKPVLNDLADLNLTHYRSLSEQQHYLSVARVPFLHAALENHGKPRPTPNGQTQKDEFKLTPHKAAVTGKDDKIGWVETTGTALKVGADNIAYLEEKMDAMGLVPVTQRSGDSTATATAINAAEANAQLKAQAQTFAQTLSKALSAMTAFQGAPATVVVSLDASFKAAPEVSLNTDDDAPDTKKQAEPQA